MITELFGNIFDEVFKSSDTGMKFIVHGCNAQGRMGSGIALEVKERFPEAYDAYMKHYSSTGLVTGEIIPFPVREDIILVNGITQEFYGYDGKRYVSYDAIQNVFSKTYELMDAFGSRSTLHFPLIGAGLAGGDWDIISTIIDKTVPDTHNKYLYKLKEGKTAWKLKM